MATLAALFGALGCGTQIHSLRGLEALSAGASGIPPVLTSLTINDASPTRSAPLSISWGVPVGSYTHYCLLENSTDPLGCVWHTGSLPTAYLDSASDGLFTLTAFLKNTYGVSDPVPSNSVTIDRTPPNLASATILNSDPTNSTSLSLSYGAITQAPYTAYCINLNDSAVAHCSWVTGSLPASYTISAVDGSKTLQVWIRDAAGNISNPVATAAITFDGTPPTVTFSSPAAGTVINGGNVSSFSVSGTCSEDGRNVVISGDASATVTCTSGAWSANLDFSSALDGSVSVTATITDAAGNGGNASRSFTKSVGVPTVAITSPAAGSYVNSANVAAFTISGTCSANGQNVVLSGDASATVACAANAWTATVDLSAASAGSITIDADHSDSFGTPAVTASRSFVKDVTGASVAITSPAAGSYVNATNSSGFSVGGTCSENGQNVVITGDASGTVACSGGAWSASLNFASAAEGSVSITATHTDAAGNAAATASRSFTKDTVLPTLASVTVLNSSPTPTRGYLLQYGTLSETIGSYCILENDTNSSHCSWTTASSLPDSFTVSATAGAKVLTVWIRDAAGNTISAGVNSNSVTYSNVLAISPSGTTNVTQTYSMESVEGMRGGHVAVVLNDGRMLYAGGCSTTYGTYYALAKIYDPVADTWTYAGQMHFPRCFAAWTKLSDGRVLVAGGSTSASASTSSAEIYDPTANAWKMTYPMGTSRAHAQATLLSSGKVLVSGGYTNTNSAANTLASTEIYDPTTEAWLTGPAMNSKRQDHQAVLRGNGTVLLIGGSVSNTAATNTSDLFTPSGATGSIAAGPTMVNTRADFSAILLSASESPTSAESILVIGGYDGNTTYRDQVELYDGTAWAAKTSISGQRRGLGTLKLSDGTIIVAGGTTSSPINTVGRYNPLGSSGSGTWTGKASLSNVTYHAILLPYTGGKVISVLGEGGYPDTGFGLVRIYDPTANTWDVSSKAAIYPLAEGNNPQTTLQLSSGKIFACGARAGTLSLERPDCYMYDPSKAALESTAQTPTYRQAPAMAEMDDGRVLVIGGTSSGKGVHRNTASIYDPSNDTWSNAGTLPSYVYGAQATSLSGNRILYAGGMGGGGSNSNSILNTTGIYDVSGGSWSTGGNLPKALEYHRLVKTPSGRIFVSGGWDGSAVSANLYEWDDGTSTWTTRASMSAGRSSHGFTYIPGGTAGKLIAAGGYSDNITTTMGSVEIYDIGTNSWSSAASFPSSATFASLCLGYVPSTNVVVFVANVSGNKNVYFYNVGANSWSTQSLAFEYGAGSTNIAGGHVCGVLNDGRFWKMSGSGERSHLEILNVATPISYSASLGDGDYTFSISSGSGGYLNDRHMFIPVVPLVSGTTTTIRVDDGSGQNASATAKDP